MNDASLESEVNIFKNVPIIDQIPALAPLLKLDGTGVPVYCHGPHGNQKLMIKSLLFLGSEISPNNTATTPTNRMIFVVIDDALDNPIGYLEFEIQENTAIASRCTFPNPSTIVFNNHQEAIWIANGLNPKSEIFGGGAFIITQDWRRFGLGQVLLAASSSVLEKKGIQKFVVFDDATIRYHNPPARKKRGSHSARLSFKSDPQAPSFVRFQPVTSAYSRYSATPITQYEFTKKGVFPANLNKTPDGAYQVPTRPSAMQVSLLTSALTQPRVEQRTIP